MIDEPLIMTEPVCCSTGLSKPSPAFLAPPSPISSRNSNEFSPLESQKMIQKQFEEIQVLRQDLTSLNQKYIMQIEQSDSAQQEKQKIESEIEDLSRRLFEQANEMVSHEKRARYVAEKKQRHLESKVETLIHDLENERAQLNELRIKFERNEYIHPLQEEQQKKEILPKSLHQKWQQLFTDFLKAAASHSIESLHRLPFLKHCMELDIEPCLKFGNTSKPKSHPLSVKRILETVMYHPCYIEPLYPKKRLSHSEIQEQKRSPTVRRVSFASFRRKKPESYCYGCGSKQVSYRFKLKEQDKDWFFIDKSCRDQLVSVCDFYVFIRHVQSGLIQGESAFQECLYLRLCMFYARSGVSL